MAPDSPLRVLVVITSDQRRGGEIQGQALAGRLGALGVEAEVVALSPSPSASRLVVSSLGDRPLGLGTLRALRRRARAVDVVVAYGGSTLPACAVALLGSGVPFVYRSIGDPDAWVRGPLQRRRTGILMRRARLVVTLWPGAAAAVSWLYGVPSSSVHVITDPPADLPPSLERSEARARFGLPQQGAIVAVIGALSAEKRVDRAVRAVARLPGVHLLVVGDGPQRSMLEALAQELLPGRFSCAGEIVDVENAYAAADLVLLTSQTEGWPAVLVEATRTGVSSAAPRVGAIGWMAQQGWVTDSFEPGAGAQEIADVCSQLLSTGATAQTVERSALAGSEGALADTAAQWTRLLGTITSSTSQPVDARGRPMSIVLVIDSLQPAGAERSTALLARGLADRGSACTVVVRRSVGGELEDDLARAGVRIVVLAGDGIVSQARDLRRLLRRERPDIVHTTLFAADMIGRIAVVGLPVRLVSSLVSMPRQPGSDLSPGSSAAATRLVNAVDRVSGRLVVDHYQAVTVGVAESFQTAYRIDPAHVTVVERGRPDVGIERSESHAKAVRSSLGLAPGSRLVLAVGRHARAKAFPDLVQAVALVARDVPDVVVVIAGSDGDDTVALRRAIDIEPVLAGRVLVLGHRDDIVDLLAAADVFVLSSRVEGAAGAVIEAMATGTPVVATRLPGLIGVLDDDHTAVLCPPGDPRLLSEALRRVLTDEALALRLAGAARAQFLSRFTLDRSVDAMVEMYAVLLGRTRDH
jgi:glycosyltransferase involved in cell wall biosynthesis